MLFELGIGFSYYIFFITLSSAADIVAQPTHFLK